MKYLLLITIILISACSPKQSERAINPEFMKIQAMVSDSFSKESAFSTVEYVEKYWRQAGNTGFNKSIFYIQEGLKRSGFILEKNATDSTRLTYRIETRKMKRPTWEPINASLSIIGDSENVLHFKTNRNMIAINSYSTPKEGVTAELIYIKKGEKKTAKDVAGKIVFAEGSAYRLFQEYVIKKNALGVLAYRMPSYTKPEKNINSIQFTKIPLNEEKKSFGIILSYRAKELLLASLKKGKTIVNVNVQTNIYESEELTVVANLHGKIKKDERFVFSAHVQEPGANDNATGVGTLLEMAETSARLLKQNKINPSRTITFLWGDEIVSTRRYLKEDSIRTLGVKWGISLDMVGENTTKTGGTFLIEKMPDPSAIWTRGNEKHSEWGGEVLTKKDMRPHYFNDFILNRMLDRASVTHWVVKTNPFEGGSDHTPFLRANKPGLLLWHFTDQFYHTDADRLENVSSETLKNVGVASLTSALILTSGSGKLASALLNETLHSALERLETEFQLSLKEVQSGKDKALQIDILNTWTDWYIKSFESYSDLEMYGVSEEMKELIKVASEELNQKSDHYIKSLN